MWWGSEEREEDEDEEEETIWLSYLCEGRLRSQKEEGGGTFCGKAESVMAEHFALREMR